MAGGVMLATVWQKANGRCTARRQQMHRRSEEPWKMDESLRVAKTGSRPTLGKSTGATACFSKIINSIQDTSDFKALKNSRFSAPVGEVKLATRTGDHCRFSQPCRRQRSKRTNVGKHLPKLARGHHFYFDERDKGNNVFVARHQIFRLRFDCRRDNSQVGRITNDNLR